MTGKKDAPIKVCLIRPGLVTTVGSISIEIILPLGIAYLAAYLRQSGMEVSVVDAAGEDMTASSPIDGIPHGIFRGLPDAETVARIPADVDVIGLSCMFSVNWVVTRQLLQAIRRRFPAATILIGGEHATALPEYCLRDAGVIDYIVLGEGEHTTLELLSALREGRDAGAVPGIAYLRDGAYVTSPPRARERELGTLPWPAWDLFDVEDHLNNVNGGLDFGRVMPIIASRGCPYECTFCSNPVMWGNLWRPRPAADVVDEIEFNIRTYRITGLDFFDLTTIVKRSWIVEFCQVMIARKVKIAWQLITTRSENIDEEVTSLLKQAGCTYILFAPESGSDEVLTAIKKKVDKEAMLRSIGYVVDHGIGAKLNFVAGFPDDRFVDILATYWFAMRAAWRGAHDASVFPFSPYPGTALFRRLLAEGRLTLNDEFFFALASYNLKQVKSFARNFSDVPLRLICLTGMVIFYSTRFVRYPGRFFSLIAEVRRGEGKTRLASSLVRVLKKRRLFRETARAKETARAGA